jgi:ribosomal protein L40E
MAVRCRECNVKRLTPKLMHLALGKYGVNLNK